MARSRVRCLGTLAAGAFALFLLSGAANPNAVPDFAPGAWGLNGNSFDFGPPPPGVSPGPLVNTSGDKLVAVGNYDSPLLQPWAAAIVKKHGDILLAGQIALDPHTSCTPMGVPYVLQVRGTVRFLQTPGMIMITYEEQQSAPPGSAECRAFPAHPAPTWMGRSIGHYEDDNTLVIDTIAIGVHETSSIDRFGTPHTEAMACPRTLHDVAGPPEDAGGFHGGRSENVHRGVARLGCLWAGDGNTQRICLRREQPQRRE